MSALIMLISTLFEINLNCTYYHYRHHNYFSIHSGIPMRCDDRLTKICNNLGNVYKIVIMKHHIRLFYEN